ncbi:BTAD domain-containing putative transcriptional regulator [Actinocrispum sp. NPDC049592]|uniref:AfsR/SARP family transcriptional regulator n=1 Tax=Actinocrispum sp. NPDC049592 TaxID=3154835 RepID=UPI00342A3CC4
MGFTADAVHSGATTCSGQIVRFEVLGPLSIVGAENRLQLRALRQRTILAVLLLDANRVVSSETLIDAVWDDAPPATARSQVHICVSAIRGVLREFGAAELIETEPMGYRIRIADDRLDARRFARLTAQATQLAGRGQIADAAALQRQALELWRGPALGDVAGPVVATTAARLDEERLAAQENCVDWELGMNRHRELISELVERVAAHPLRERSRAQLMLALHRSGRQAEALETFRNVRKELIDQLGLEPGEQLRRLEAQILADDPRLHVDAPAGQAVRPAQPAQRTQPAVRTPVRQLPADIADFAGRDDLVARLTGLLSGEPAMPVVVATGIGGAGKSALAVHVAHLLAGKRFADGQLYARLTGAGRPQQACDVLSRFLRALGVPHTGIPEDIEERAELYRSLLADRHMLVLLDDAGSESQVRPLLPGSASCGVLITSRAKLTGLAGARLLHVPAFDTGQAGDLLGRIAGPERVDGDRRAVTELTRLVGGLPLGLRVIGARLRARPHWTLSRMVRQLSGEDRRLDELTHGDLSVRETMASTYHGLPVRERRLLSLLSDLGTDAFPGWMAAAVLDTGQADEYEALELLENLVETYLIEVVTGEPVRYRVHELARIYAGEQTSGDLPRLRAAVRSRMRISGLSDLGAARRRPSLRPSFSLW